jgi:hypothetical protein
MPEDTRTKCEGGILDGQFLATPADEARCREGGGRVIDSSTSKCFIATAATGSSDSEEIANLRQLRSRARNASRIADHLIDAVYSEYVQFSPAIAAEIDADAFAREIVLRVVVKPLVAWYTLAAKLGLEHSHAAAVASAVNDLTHVCPAYLQPAGIVAVLEAIRSDAAFPDGIAGTLGVFAERTREAARFPIASWAIVEPLVRVWKSAAEHLDPIREVAQWLATAPLERLALSSSSDLVDDDLSALSQFFDFAPEARRQLGERLLAAWPDSAVALRRNGFAA